MTHNNNKMRQNTKKVFKIESIGSFWTHLNHSFALKCSYIFIPIIKLALPATLRALISSYFSWSSGSTDARYLKFDSVYSWAQHTSVSGDSSLY